MHVLYYASMLRCWHLIWILVRTNHPCLGVGCHISNIVANALATKLNNNGDKGSPCLRPLSVLKKICGSPFMLIPTLSLVTTCYIHSIHL
jgi:hypothetical protein